MQLGLVGLGKMGANMATRLRDDGHEVIGYDLNPDSGRTVDSLEAMVEALQAPRAVWVMLPSGEPTAQTISALSELLSSGDVIVDGGNSNYLHDQAHAQMLAKDGIGFIDCGVSGGVWGLQVGYALMCGGSADDVRRLQPVFDSLAPDGEHGFVHAGPVGAGHFSKMVHNGIEYGMMQSYAEGYELLEKADLVEDVDAVFASWQSGTVIRSWLLELLVNAVTADPGLTEVSGYVEDSGEGRWTVQAAIDHAVPMPAITAALFARFASRQDDALSMRVVAALRNQFGGHAVRQPGRQDDAK